MEVCAWYYVSKDRQDMRQLEDSNMLFIILEGFPLGRPFVFCKLPPIGEAVSKVSTWDNQRAMKVIKVVDIWSIFRNLLDWLLQTKIGYEKKESGNKYVLLDVLLCCVAEYFNVLWGESKYKQRAKILSDTTQKKRLMKDLLSNTPNCYVWGGEFYRECVTEVCEAKPTWRGKSS